MKDVLRGDQAESGIGVFGGDVDVVKADAFRIAFQAQLGMGIEDIRPYVRRRKSTSSDFPSNVSFSNFRT